MTRYLSGCQPTFKRIAVACAFSFFCSVQAQQPGAISVGSDALSVQAETGDTLTTIAEKFTDKGSNWNAIGKYNHIKNDRAIPIGYQVKIPFQLLREVQVQAKVVAFAGAARMGPDSASAQAVAIGRLAAEGMLVLTGKNEFVTLELPDKSRISIPSNSTLKLTKLRVRAYANSPITELTLITGRVESSVSSLKENNGRYEVHTPLSIAGVRGTHFRVDAADGQVGNEVLEGNVVVGRDTGLNARSNSVSNSISLPAGTGAVVSATALGAVTPLLPAPQLQNSTAVQERILVKFITEANSLAKSYRAQIAVDSQMQNLIQENLFVEPVFKFSDLDDGDYFIRVTAIDRQGLEGIPSVTPFKLKARPEPPFNIAPKKKTRAQQVEFSWSEAADAISYHLQIASDAQFQHLLQDQPQLSAHQYTAEHLPLGRFFWRVATISMKNGKPDHGPFGDVEPVDLMAPAANLPPVSDQGGAEMQFSWSAEAGQHFVLQMSDDPKFNHLIVDKQLATPEFNLARPPAGSYYLRVQAIDADGYIGAFSSTQRISIFNMLVSGDGSPVNSAAGVIRSAN